MKNYIEIKHAYIEDKNTELESENEDVWWAVRPSPDTWKFKKKDSFLSKDFNTYPWMVKGELNIYDSEDLHGLRKLLDEIEKIMLVETGEV